MKINGTDIYIIRGDSETFEFRLEDYETGEKINLIPGDLVYFTVKASTQTSNKLIHLLITEFEDGEAKIHIRPQDTKPLKYHTYVYDVQIEKQGNVSTVIKPSKFVVEEEVTYE